MKNYKIAVAGTGYVGLSLGVLFAQHHQVVAVDIVQAKVDMINNKKSPIQDDYMENSEKAKRKNLLMGSNPIIAPDSEMLWNAAIVWRILRRYEYTGALVMGRRKKIDVNTTSVRTLPEDKWIIAENAHEAIVTKDEYYQAQKAIRNVTPIQYKVDAAVLHRGSSAQVFHWSYPCRCRQMWQRG